MIRTVQLWLAWRKYRKARAAYDDAEFYKRLAAQRAEEGAALERASTVMRLEATTS